MQKHNLDQENGDLEIVIEARVQERRHNVQRPIFTIENEMRRNPENNGTRITKTMFKKWLTKMEVAEIYSPPRATEMARRMGLKSGWALDIITNDVDGRPWGFNHIEMRNRAIRQVLRDEPLLIIGSPMCTVFSQLNNINDIKMPRE